MRNLILLSFIYFLIFTFLDFLFTESIDVILNLGLSIGLSYYEVNYRSKKKK